jgi:hypothetical protein
MNAADAALARLKRRLAVVAVIDVLCLIVGGYFLFGFLFRQTAWMGYGFGVSMVVGFLAQLWLIFTFARDRPPN